MTEVLDANKKREVATLDIVYAFLQSNKDKTINMLLGGKLAKMMVSIDLAV